MFVYPPSIGFDQALMVSMPAGICFNDLPSSRMLWSNFMLGTALQYLYQASPFVPWFFLMLLGSALLVVSIYWCIACENKTGYAIAVFGVVFVPVFGNLLVELNFTTAALGLLLGGGVLFCRGIERNSDRTVLSGCAVALLGFLIRDKMLPIALVLLCPLFFYSISSGKAIGQGFFRKLLAALGCLTGLFFSTYMLNLVQYSHDGWQEYRRASKCSTEVRDRMVLEAKGQDELEAQLASVGWSVNDYRLFLNWYALDGDIYSLEKQEALLSNAGPRFKPEELKRYRYRYREIADGLCFLALAPLVLIGCRSNLKAARCVILTALIALSLFVAFAITYKLAPPRIYIPLFSAPVLIGLALNSELALSAATRRVRRFAIIFALAGAMAAFINLSQAIMDRERHYAEVGTDLARLSEYIDREPKSPLILAWGTGLPFRGVSALEIEKVARKLSVVRAAFPSDVFPPTLALFERHGVQNANISLVDNDRVLVAVLRGRKGELNHDPTLLESYFLENYDRVVHLRNCADFKTFSLYKIVSSR